MADQPQVIKTKIGPAFQAEFTSAGVTAAGFSWSSFDVTIMPDMNAAQRAVLLNVIAAHNPNAVAPNTGEQYSLRTSKVAFFRRCTDDEAAQFTADLSDASPRLKAIFDSVTYLIPGTDEYPELRGAVEARVGPDRATVLLAPSND